MTIIARIKDRSYARQEAPRARVVANQIVGRHLMESINQAITADFHRVKMAKRCGFFGNTYKVKVVLDRQAQEALVFVEQWVKLEDGPQDGRMIPVRWSTRFSLKPEFRNNPEDSLAKDEAFATLQEGLQDAHFVYRAGVWG